MKLIAIVPAVALGIGAASGAAQAADNKRQFKYQDKPKGRQRCSGCKLFNPPHGCKVVTGKISPNGWCIAWAKK
ncbi:MAG: high-potential iron-sulfur protein [Candidatus Eremiobacteraeota bacterium]|nr:high-potential iron-sulfur protein [Candidatus Eremiobacteraeota bacterium]